MGGAHRLSSGAVVWLRDLKSLKFCFPPGFQCSAVSYQLALKITLTEKIFLKITSTHTLATLQTSHIPTPKQQKQHRKHKCDAQEGEPKVKAQQSDRSFTTCNVLMSSSAFSSALARIYHFYATCVHKCM